MNRYLNYVNQGQRVLFKKDGRWVPCEVITAAGVSARIENQLINIDTWVHVEELREAPEIFQAVKVLG